MSQLQENKATNAQRCRFVTCITVLVRDGYRFLSSLKRTRSAAKLQLRKGYRRRSPYLHHVAFAVARNRRTLRESVPRWARLLPEHLNIREPDLQRGLQLFDRVLARNDAARSKRGRGFLEIELL